MEGAVVATPAGCQAGLAITRQMPDAARKGFMRILCVHPNYELYGSDRSFAALVGAMVQQPGWEVRVLLPRTGPILSLPGFAGADVQIHEMWVLRRRDLVRGLTLGLPRNLMRLWRAWRDMARADCNYINTVIGFDFIVASRFIRRPVLIHVREIPNGLEMRVFRALLLWSKAVLVFNSHATRDAFRLPRGVRSHVVYNGQAPAPDAAPPDWDGSRPLRILMIGRINHWKGQEILVAAIGLLSEAERARVIVRFVGGTFNNQDDFRDALVTQIERAKLTATIRLGPFEDDPGASYHAADVVVVPSRLPEPFGRVAIEAMSFGRPVIASAHGGLVEIVQDGETGRLFAPGDAGALADILRALLAEPAQLRRFGEAGLQRFFALFTLDATNAQFIDILRAETASQALGPAP